MWYLRWLKVWTRCMLGSLLHYGVDLESAAPLKLWPMTVCQQTHRGWGIGGGEGVMPGWQAQSEPATEFSVVH